MSSEYIEAPLPGVFYRRPDPDEDVFVEVGDSVAKGDTVALIGVMKNFNQVPSPFNGTIVEVLVEDEAEIEASDPLFEIETN